jgi:serine/threonine protein kinase
MDHPGASQAQHEVKGSFSSGESLAPLSPDAPAPDVKPTVPDYELLRRIGHGAYGEVWLARSKATGALRAAKIVRRLSFDDDRPFRREFEGIQRFERISREHPSQLALFHIGRNEPAGYFYYVMELADQAPAVRRLTSKETEAQNPKSEIESEPPDVGCYSPHTLRADLEHGRLHAARALEIGLALAEALSHLHSHGLVHRDVKPSNVIFVKGRPKLADIGLVTDASDQCSIVGTEGYLPPEGPGTPQADIFALGKVLYEAVTGLGRRDFPEVPPDVRSWPDVAQVFELNETILKACAKDSGNRFPSAEAMLGELKRLRAGKSTRRARQVEHGWRLAWRGTAWLTAITAVLALIVIAVRVRQPIAPNVEKRSTNEAANILFDLGKAHFDVFEGTNMATASDYFRRAIQADTNFAQAYGYLASTYSWGGFGDWNPNLELMPRAKEVALRALALDPSLAEPHLALGCYYVMREWDWIAAEKHFKRAVVLDSTSPFCHLSYGEFLKMVGRMPKAIDEINKARALNPSSRLINERSAHILVSARQFTNALHQIERVNAMEPGSEFSGVKQGIYCALGQFDDAIDAERASRIHNGESPRALDRELGELKHAIGSEGPKVYWRREVETAKKRNDVYQQACCYAQLRDPEAAFACLDKLVTERYVWLTFMVKTEWMLDPLRSDPRFHKILKTMHLE